MHFLRHLFAPRHSNNFRAKILHNSSLAVIVLFVLAVSSFTFFIKSTHPEVLGISYTIDNNDLLTDTNKARAENGASPLVLNEKLTQAAEKKADHMFANHYWAHFAPDGTTPWSFIKESGYDYSFAGENLAKGFTDSQEVVDAWMNSPSHKENLLSTKYKDIGFAIKEGNLEGEDTVLVVQMFGTQSGVGVDGTENVPTEITTVPTQAARPQQVSAARNSNPQPVVDAPFVTKSLVLVFLAFIVVVLALDLLIVEKKKIPRIVGHNLDHIILLILFLLFIILTTSKGIL